MKKFFSSHAGRVALEIAARVAMWVVILLPMLIWAAALSFPQMANWSAWNRLALWDYLANTSGFDSFFTFAGFNSLYALVLLLCVLVISAIVSIAQLLHRFISVPLAQSA
jgi:hypothetical protein